MPFQCFPAAQKSLIHLQIIFWAKKNIGATIKCKRNTWKTLIFSLKNVFSPKKIARFWSILGVNLELERPKIAHLKANFWGNKRDYAAFKCLSLTEKASDTKNILTFIRKMSENGQKCEFLSENQPFLSKDMANSTFLPVSTANNFIMA